MSERWLRSAAVLWAALLLLPVGALAEAWPAEEAPPPAPGSVVRAPGAGLPADLPMRTPLLPDVGAAADLPVSPPKQGRVPEALPGTWTVLVYMVADNDLEPFAIEDINEMEAVTYPPSLRVVVEVDRSARYDNSNGDWTGTRRYVVAHDTLPAAISSPLIEDLGELNLGDPQVLADFLAWGADAYPAERYLVVLWDHGYGWSGGFGNDLGSNDHLSLPELGAALRAAADHIGRPFDLLGFDACLLQQVEVAYEFAWVADFLVGAEDLEPADGWPYEEVFGALAAAPNQTAEQLSRAVVDAYMGYYGFQGEVMMSAVRLSAVRTALADAMNALAGELAALVEPPASAANDSVARALLDARAGAPKMWNVDYLDLGAYARSLAQDVRLPPQAQAAARQVVDALNLTLVAEAHSVYRVGLWGISAYVPATSLPSRYLTTRFGNESFWDEFLVAALSGVAVGGARPSVQVISPSEGAQVARKFQSSASATGPAGSFARIEYKAGWENWTALAAGQLPLSVGQTLDAGRDVGPALLSFRAVEPSGRPSAVVERQVGVEAPPVTLSPPLERLGLAVNRTRVVTLNATPRDPFLSFDISWTLLPAGVSGAGTTTSVTLPGLPPAPFPIRLELSVAPGAAEGTFAAQLVVRPSGQASLATFLDLVLDVTRPLADLSVGPVALSSELPLPGEAVWANTSVGNIGFENASGVRYVATYEDPGGNVTELANVSAGALAAGSALAVAVNFGAQRGVQRVTVRASAEPPVEELATANNEASAVLEVVNLSVRLRAPTTLVHVALGAGPTPALVEVANRGIDDDRYDLALVNLTNSSWQVALPFASLFVPGRSTTSFSVDVLPPLLAEGGDFAGFALTASSQADSAVSASLNFEARIDEVFNASLRAQPNDLELSAGGAATSTILLQNTGNGRESFALLVQGADAALGAALSAASFSLAAGAGASARLDLADGGLLAADRPYSLEVVAVSLTSGLRFASIVSVRVLPSPALEAEALEPRIEAPASGPLAFHARIRNIGNTNVVASFAVGAADPALSANLSVAAALLAPGESLVVNGSAAFAQAPQAGDYAAFFSAADERTGANASAAFTVVVPRVREYEADLVPSPSSGPRSLDRELRIVNLGNAPEVFRIIVGYVPPGITLVFTPPNLTVEVAPWSNVSIHVTVTGPAEAAASGEIPVDVSPVQGPAAASLRILYNFAAPPGNPLPAWAAVLGATALALGAWGLATRRKPPGAPGRPR